MRNSERKLKKNPDLDFQIDDKKLGIDEVSIEKWSDTKIRADSYAPWYDQFMKLPDKVKVAMARDSLDHIKKEKPKAYQQIVKNGCRLVGVMPRVEYALVDEKLGDTGLSWIHSFSMATLLYWDPVIESGLFVNVNLLYDDSRLNHIKGNSPEKLKGFTH